MGSAMHRLQICVEDRQYRFLAARAKREGISVAELVRRLVQREADVTQPAGIEDLLAVAGIGEDRGPLVNGTPVSEWPELYLTPSESCPDEC
ncbi:MAG: hypothetical protein ACYC5O_14325 [Anaerolineae bacterium]